jgi:hypothetical protein
MSRSEPRRKSAANGLGADGHQWAICGKSIGMKQPIKPWRDRAPKADPSYRCCWVCGGIGGNGFTMALRLAGYRMAPGEMGYAHNDCMRKAQIQAMQHQRER